MTETPRAQNPPSGSGYAELHAHSSFSFLDGVSSPMEMAQTAAELGLSALALTDHNGLYGAVRHHHACRAAGIKPIFGCELDLEDGAHIVLLAEDLRGWSSLCRLISRAQMDHRKGSAALDPALLTPDAVGGLIALTACPERGVLAKPLREGRREDAYGAAERLRQSFDRDHLFVEVQRHLLPGDRWLNDELLALARSLGLRTVATTDAHYARAAGRDLHDVKVAIRNRTTLDEAERRGLLRHNGEYRLRSAGEMAEQFPDCADALRASVEIAERCRVDLDMREKRFPAFEVPAGESPFSFLYKLCHQGAVERYRPLTPEVLQRLNHELQVIEKLGLAEFFLINWDIMRFSREHRIPAQGRGSAADSLVAYVLGITRVDPIEHRLLFERFLHEDMTSMPDIDIDFAADDRHRERVIQYVYQKYGAERTGMVCNVVTYRPRSAIRQVGKALGISEDLLDQVAKAVDGWYPDQIPDALAAVGLSERADSPAWDDFLRLGQEICGHPRHLSIHVGGMLVTGDPLVEMVPLERATMPDRVVVQFDKDDVEDLGLIKMDLLGLRMLAVMAEALEQVEADTGVRPDLDRLPLDDRDVYRLCQEPDTIGVFQIESRAQMATLPRTRPSKFDDLVVEVAIIRPGPIQGNAVNPYISRRQGREPVSYLDPRLEPILRDTMGVILYQEQILEISMTLAGYTAGQADRFRRAMNRHRSRADMEALRESFVSGCLERDTDPAVAEELFRQLAAFAEFGFTKSHAAAFARTAYESAWLKLYHPAALYAGLLNQQPMGFYPPAVIVEDARRHGVRILSVDVNESRARCRVQEGALRLGFNYVKGIGESVLDLLDAERARGEYRSAEDFVRRTRLKRDVVNRLIRVGAFDSFGADRRALLWRDPGAIDASAMVDPAPDPVPLRPMSDLERVAADYEVLSLSTERHLVSFYREAMHRLGVINSEQLRSAADGARVRVAGLVITRQAPETARGLRFFTLEDEWGHINATIYPDLYRRRRLIANRSPLLMIDGVVQRADGVVSVLAREIAALEDRGSGLAVRAPRAHNYTR